MDSSPKAESLREHDDNLSDYPLNQKESIRQWSIAVPEEQPTLSRHGTLLTSNATPSRNAVELKSILGNSNARLKPGASLLPNESVPGGVAERTSLEQAKPRARVEVDIIPESNILVQGGFFNGIVKIRIRPRARRESAILVGSGKIRVIGFECIQNEDHRYMFFQQSALLSSVTKALDRIYFSPADNEGFREPEEGVHVLPFSMLLPLEAEAGAPKGTIVAHAGVSIRYIAMFSVKVRERETDRRSIAHFYRDCEVWPRLNPASILAPTPSPIQASTTRTLFLGGSGKVILKASLHRLNWVAGQFCHVKVNVANQSKKAIKSLTLSLVRSTVAFKPKYYLDVGGSKTDHDPDACQTSTTQKRVTETVLEMGDSVARGHASAKGWWSGVQAGETVNFFHCLLLPVDSLSVPRERLLQVQYAIRVGVSAGPLSSDIHVSIPVNIINFLSVDPPPSYLDNSPEDLLKAALAYETGAASQHIDQVSGLLPTNEVLKDSAPGPGSLPSYPDLPADLGNFVECDDNDALVQHAITSAAVATKYAEFGSRFADLYYTSIPSDLAAEAESDSLEGSQVYDDTQSSSGRQSLLPSPHSSHLSISELSDSPPFRRPREPNAFMKRVQRKLEESRSTLYRQDRGQRHERGSDDSDAAPTEKQISSHHEEHLSQAAGSVDGSLSQAKAGCLRSEFGESRRLVGSHSCTIGSYFRPRHEIPDEVEREESESEYLTDCSNVVREQSALSMSVSVPDIVSSQASHKSTVYTSARLPQPSNVSALISSFLAKAESQSVVCQDPIGIAQFHHVPPASDRVYDILPAAKALIPVTTGDYGTEAIVPNASRKHVGRVRSYTASSAPQTPSSSHRTCTNASYLPESSPDRQVVDTKALDAPKSVKEKIRELEERAKLEMNA
ncbi:hypothetical protein VKT23_005380 [Stygiomarasmius scandens]|uniref:Arrestin C-terminal-like domain-containing protein n=1 Tax=Marasmiellus scandens TaxID=2682957 RepID=A0ABR1JQ36_9AGAR